MDIDKLIKEIISHQYFRSIQLKKYLQKNNIDKKYWLAILLQVIKTNYEIVDYYSINEILINIVIENSNDVKNFLSLLDILVDRNYEYDNIQYLIMNLQYNIEQMKVIYEQMKLSDKPLIKKLSANILGLIGRRSPQVLFDEVEKTYNSNNFEKELILCGLSISSFKPFRHINFIPPKFVIEFIIQSINHNHTEIAIIAARVAIRMFDLYDKFYENLKNYINRSANNKINFLNSICYDQLYGNRKAEVLLLMECSKTEAVDTINLVLSIFSYKLTDKYIDIEDKISLQKISLDLIKKWHSNKFIKNIQNRNILKSIGNVNINYTFEYLKKWICCQDNVKEIESIIAKIILYIFNDYEDKLIDFLLILYHNEKNEWDNVLNLILKEMLSDIRFDLDHELASYNSNIQKAERIIPNNLNNFYAYTLDNILIKINDILKIINDFHFSDTDSNYRKYEILRKELEKKKQFFDRKIRQLNRTLELLNRISLERNFNFDRLTKVYDNKPKSIILKCERLRVNIFEGYEIKSLDLDIIKKNFEFFPTIKNYFGHKWLVNEYKNGHPYHPLLIWLSIITNSSNIDQLSKEIKDENDTLKKNIKIREILQINYILTDLYHLEEYLKILDTHIQGRKKIIDGLKGESTFFQFLSQLEIASRLINYQYKIKFEEPSINGRYIDILASKDGSNIIFELFTLEELSELKYSGFAADIQDKAKSTMIEKMEQISEYAKQRPDPIIIIVNLTYAPEQDIHGILYSLNGVNTDHIFFTGNKEIVKKRSATLERDPEFLKIDSSKLSAVVYYRKKTDITKINFYGGIIPNKSTERKLQENTIKELKNSLFEN